MHTICNLISTTQDSETLMTICSGQLSLVPMGTTLYTKLVWLAGM